MQRDKTLLDYFYVLVKWRKLIIWPVIAVALLSSGVALVLPERWEAENRTCPAKKI